MGLVVRSYAFRSLPDVMDKGTFLRAERLRVLRHGAEQIVIEFRDEQGDRHELVFAENIPGCFVSHRRIMEATTPRKPQEKPCIRIIENVEFTKKNGLYIPTYMRMGYKNFIPGKEDSEPGHLRVTRFDFRTDLSLARILAEEAEASVIDMRTLEMRPSKAVRKEGLARLKEQIRKTNEHLAKEFQGDESKRVMAVPNELSAKVIAAIVAGLGALVIAIAIYIRCGRS